MSFEGPYGVYHSVYDNHHWVARFGDPGFRYHVALVQLWAWRRCGWRAPMWCRSTTSRMRKRIEDFAADAERLWMQRPAGGAAIEAMAPVRQAASGLRSAAARFNARRQAALEDATDDRLVHLNRQLISVERAFLDSDGLRSSLVSPPYLRPEVYLCARDASGCHGSCDALVTIGVRSSRPSGSLLPFAGPRASLETAAK